MEAAQLELETYRTEVRVSDVGAEAWKRDVATRQAALDLARRSCARSSRRSPRTPDVPTTVAAMDRDANARFVARVVVHPVGPGTDVPVAERVDVYFIGADEPAAAAARAVARARYDEAAVKIPRDQVDRFIAEHGGIVVFGDGPDGPVYLLADGWNVFIPVDGDRPAEAWQTTDREEAS